MSVLKGINNLQVFSDEELCSMTLDGNDCAFSELFLRYSNLIMLKISSYYKSNVDIDDLFQEGVLGLLNAAKSYNTQKGASFKTYASICIERKIINLNKSLGKSKVFAKNNLLYCKDDDFHVLKESSGCQSQNPEDLVIGSESLCIKKEKIRKLLSKLEYNVLSLYLSGHNYSEISEILSVSSKCVDNALQRIRKKLIVLK